MANLLTQSVGELLKPGVQTRIDLAIKEVVDKAVNEAKEKVELEIRSKVSGIAATLATMVQ